MLIEPSDPDTIRTAIECVLADELARRLATNAGDAAGHNRWERRAERVLSVLRERTDATRASTASSPPDFATRAV
jgi:glycosyltransferase involved in cell wall biosynthesis